ncbi:P63C domain-containing protein [Halotia branconii]|uniref:P63C domain-containing protein n=1 Tax=Halotia branconii CENA392 TaxID=1539056 RepID=A0AAJ6NYF8_9CYAN|nr:P63C domain-containing protein [Halotia branconii]WGV29059.1 P63C domain-containing protein [Halotia branconii CENA392]
MAKKNYKAAEAVEFYIGNYRFDAVRVIETKEYRMSQGQILTPIGVNRNWLGTLPKKAPKVYQSLVEQGLNHDTLSTQYTVNSAGTRADTIPLRNVRIIWRYFDKQGNLEAQKLIDALSEDSLISRFEQVWGESRTVEQRRFDDSRILDTPRPWTRMFESEFEENLARITKLHKKSIRNGLYYWEFIYGWMTPEEKAKLDIVNPVLPNGRRRNKIHQMLSDQTKERLTPHVTSILILMKSANSVDELRRLVSRQYGVDQPNLFDGWNLG